ncbi:alpha/beta hydrolase fold domain-containing protein [Flammeovirga yaeyamensis]|uniref:Alpha/beta hydrolase fold domain-containing protein n=1 Tax=Flammeovirga yaeyamensis TaxID=367791 RepID=A0AAX1N0H6_9BACT|nr:alpha/beta hydrolase [Flammeovirga yaeyamensis]MBB3700238.1 acetyl esterase/lipase [Flammeovirga yaeyamensis]NMF37136.1 alpha/beta hydrolase [Flammeovirga yaeyamensis]QWG00827.1 alpha/beta hydrolase fold domain-containing protein [Flammeovirga yaeyamensis]
MSISIQHRLLKLGLNLTAIAFPSENINLTLLRESTELVSLFALLPWGVKAKKLTLDGITAEVISPVKEHVEKKALLYLHGGGYAIGSSQTHRSLVGKIVDETKVTAVLVNYRKIPEFPCPAAIEDALKGYQYLLDLGYHPDQIAVAGDSAGGGLVCSFFFMLNELKKDLPKCGICLSPWMDLEHTGSSTVDNKYSDPFVKVNEMQNWAQVYAGNKPLKDPMVSPLNGNFSNFPPMLIQTSSNEVLYSDSTRLRDKLMEAKREVTYQEWDGLIHWWQLFWRFIPESEDAINKVCDFLNSKLKVS